MGQKTHPLGFRLGITQEHKSKWYANFNQYSNLLNEDDKIRTYINTIEKKNNILNIRINRNNFNNEIHKIQLNIETGKFKELMTRFETLLTNLKKILPSNRQLTMNVFEVKKVALNASFLANLVAEQLEKRIAFRRAIRDALKIAKEEKKEEVKGIKIQVSGRLNGAEIARSEWIREGRVPLQTLRADIDYATKEANTIYGVLGIKVWLFKSEILSKKKKVFKN